MTAHPHKRGDTFHFVGLLPDWFDAQGVTARCQVRTSAGQHIDDLDVTLDAGTRSITLHKQVTDDWPVGLAQIDVQFTLPSGYVISTTTADLRIVRDVTQ